MLFKILADVVVWAHFIWIIFLIFGAVWGVRSRVIKIVHLSGFLFAILLQVLGWYCPLTHLEVWLRSKHNPSIAYAGSFIIHYVERLVYLEISPTTVFVLTVFLSLFNLCVYLRMRRL